MSDPEVMDALSGHVGQGEQVGAVPSWVPCGLMDLSTLERFMYDHLDRVGDEVFRVEGLPLYDVTSDPNWRRWLDGASEPDWTVKQAWLDELAGDVERGIRHYRVRIMGEQLGEHEIYECNWGYALNVAPHGGTPREDIRVLRRGEHRVPERLIGLDYWLVNDTTALPTLYDSAGGFVGAGWLDSESSARFRTERDLLWAAAEPFGSWWARHPEFHQRDVRSVAQAG